MSRLDDHNSVLDKNRFGQMLKRARVREGFTSIDVLAKHLEEAGIFISPRQLRRYECGTHLPTCDVLAGLIRALPSDRGAFYLESLSTNAWGKFTFGDGRQIVAFSRASEPVK
jgi:transcriptional regulator with XRE-family HTH domain